MLSRKTSPLLGRFDGERDLTMTAFRCFWAKNDHHSFGFKSRRVRIAELAFLTGRTVVVCGVAVTTRGRPGLMRSRAIGQR